MDKNDIAGLIEALCDAPPDGEAVRSAERSPEFLALRREAAQALREAVLAEATAQAGDEAPDADALTAALAAVLSGTANEAARKTLAELVTRSASARLDADSAAAFVEAVEQSTAIAPAHLVEEFSEAEAASVPRAAAESFWSRIADSLRSIRAYRIAAAFSVVLLASAASWSVYWREHAEVSSVPAANIESAAPAEAKVESAKTEGAKAESTSPTPAVADVPAPPAAPKPALAVRQPCEPQARALETLKTARETLETRSSVVADKKADAIPAGSGCDAAPADDADAAIKQAGEEAEQARRNAAAPASSAPAAAAVGTTQTQAAPANPVFGRAQRPAAATAAPAAKPATRPREPR